MKQNGGSAVDAVEKAVRVFEEHDHFNAGRGSFLNVCDEVECDAMIMDGNSMKTGKQFRKHLYTVYCKKGWDFTARFNVNVRQ